MAEPEITVDKSAEENGLANMVAELLRENVQSSPRKRAAFDRMKGSVGITATDAEVALTLEFDRGRCAVHDGIVGVPDVAVSTDSESILQLSNVKLVGGLPYFFDATGRDVLGKMSKRTIAIRGMVRHPVLLTRLTIVLSVN